MPLGAELGRPVAQITVGGMRVRVKLDEHRIEELLRGSEGSGATSAAARVLSCLGDMGQVSFMPQNGGARPNAGVVRVQGLGRAAGSASAAGHAPGGIPDASGASARARTCAGLCASPITTLCVQGRLLTKLWQAAASLLPHGPDLLPTDDGSAYYAVAVETGEVSNLSAEMGLVSFRTGEGISPGRLIRVAHALARACLLYLRGGAFRPDALCSAGGAALRWPGPACSACTVRPTAVTLYAALVAVHEAQPRFIAQTACRQKAFRAAGKEQAAADIAHLDRHFEGALPALAPCAPGCSEHRPSAPAELPSAAVPWQRRGCGAASTEAGPQCAWL